MALNGWEIKTNIYGSLALKEVSNQRKMEIYMVLMPLYNLEKANKSTQRSTFLGFCSQRIPLMK